jgi:hypothetical protein
MSRLQTSARVAKAAAIAVLLASCSAAPPTSNPGGGSGRMGFFLTSVGSGNGADLGGLAGADAHCQKLAAAAGAGSRTWRAYLSASATQNAAAIHARERIGKGPWHNAKGEMVARDVAHLHNGNNVTKATALTERGEVVKGRGDTPNEHDILTGSRLDGTALSPNPNLTCNNWTSSGEGSAMIGHHDRVGPTTDAWAQSWNSSHQTRGCGQEALKSTGGAGYFYCFAAD